MLTSTLSALSALESALSFCAFAYASMWISSAIFVASVGRNPRSVFVCPPGECELVFAFAFEFEFVKGRNGVQQRARAKGSRDDVQRTTLRPLPTAARTSWWAISPVRYTSASTPRSTSAPEPAQIATECTAGMSRADVYAIWTIRHLRQRSLAKEPGWEAQRYGEAAYAVRGPDAP